MGEYTVKKIDEMEAAFGGGFVRARASLGASAFGFQIIQLPPAYDGYPEHDHADSGQEEVFVALKGSGTMRIDGTEIPLDQETLVRVDADVRRHVSSGPDGLRMLVIGGTPGKAYEAPAVTELGGPEQV